MARCAQLRGRWPPTACAARAQHPSLRAHNAQGTASTRSSRAAEATTRTSSCASGELPSIQAAAGSARHPLRRPTVQQSGTTPRWRKQLSAEGRCRDSGSSSQVHFLTLRRGAHVAGAQVRHVQAGAKDARRRAADGLHAHPAPHRARHPHGRGAPARGAAMLRFTPKSWSRAGHLATSQAWRDGQRGPSRRACCEEHAAQQRRHAPRNTGGCVHGGLAEETPPRPAHPTAAADPHLPLVPPQAPVRRLVRACSRPFSPQRGAPACADTPLRCALPPPALSAAQTAPATSVRRRQRAARPHTATNGSTALPYMVVPSAVRCTQVRLPRRQP